jgi:hypothetical protein
MVLHASTSTPARAALAADYSRQDELARLLARQEQLNAESEALTARLAALQEQSNREARDREQMSKKATQRLFAPAPGLGSSL